MAQKDQPQAPAVVIIARHGMRLDAADQSWHLSTPAPYDPPLTYGGWQQCRTLGTRIASLLYAREQEYNNAQPEASDNGTNGTHTPRRRKKKKHRVVIHTSPFLRCLQTSVAISAGMAQFEEPGDKTKSSKPKSPGYMHSGLHSPRLHAMSGSTSPSLAPIAEPKHDLAHQLARRTLAEHKRYRKAKIRVDAFLGEWLNPQYFDHITPPPPSPLMVAGAKAELHQNEAVDLFTPTISHRSSNNSLWSGNNTRPQSSKSSLDDWSHVTNALHAPTPRRDRSNSASSVGSNDSHHSHHSASGRKSPFRPSHMLQPLTSTIPKPEYSVYHPPIPSYAISNADHIPRGYVSHARNATVDVDYNWDSSRPPLSWGDGGDFGEEWSSMHRRFRRGLNNMIAWYSEHDANDRGEDALGLEQADRPSIYHYDEEEEDLVVVMVTHGAGSNALIGGLTSQPVLLDVGMASLTMAVRKQNAPPLAPSHAASTPDGTSSPSPEPGAMQRRRSAYDLGLSDIYEMKLVASSEHLRPGVDPTKLAASNATSNVRTAKEALAKYKRVGGGAHAEAGAGIDASWNLGEPKPPTGPARTSSNSALGSIRRPSAPTINRSNTQPVERVSSPPPFTTGLWTPPSGRSTPLLNAQKLKEEKDVLFSKLNDRSGRNSPIRKSTLDSNGSLQDSRPGTANSQQPSDQASADTGDVGGKADRKTVDSVLGMDGDEAHDEIAQEAADEIVDLPQVAKEAPSSLSRGLSVKTLWGRPQFQRTQSEDKVTRTWNKQPKRRWTVTEHD
ncbi:Putative histidine phosphatase superfamily, clade-1 [Septoria linicola]|uniref:Histidine phosphatase superfamily, clade-1 n=1 Tax=Septoria linicola TaxID=215465 RepID=A0A9Q9EFT2_9PEZI|nr:Putative histidine phosphatase superfamily, clade-1 [Septoria linicola]